MAELEGRVEPARRPRPRQSKERTSSSARGPIVEDPEPPIEPGWLGSSWLGLPIDFDFYFSAEAVASADRFLVDDVDQFEYYRSLGHFEGWPAPAGSVGEALAEEGSPARVLCCNLGVGALDAAFAARVLAAAEDRGSEPN